MNTPIRAALLAATSVLLFSGCHKGVVEPEAVEGTLRITFVPEWEGAPLAFFTEYRNISDYRMQVELLKFYWSDVRLVNGFGDTPLKDIALFDLQQPVTVEWPAEAGIYTGLQAGLGVSPELNHTDPVSYPTGHPLSVGQNTYWTWESGFRFVLFEGRYDPDPASTVPLTATFSIHTGRDTCYRVMEIPSLSPIVVADDSVTHITVHVAVDRFFYSPTTLLDLSTENQSHGNNLPLALKFTDHVAQSFTID